MEVQDTNSIPSNHIPVILSTIRNGRNEEGDMAHTNFDSTARNVRNEEGATAHTYLNQNITNN
jgi:hypothetical protein